MKPTLCSILIVEDNDDIRLMLEIHLQMMGYAVAAVPSYEAAVAQAKEKSFDLYLLDHRLVDGTGRELRAKLREISPDTPALYCTGTQYPRTEIDALQQAGDRFLLKPVETQKLKDTIAGLVAKRF